MWHGTPGAAAGCAGADCVDGLTGVVVAGGVLLVLLGVLGAAADELGLAVAVGDEPSPPLPAASCTLAPGLPDCADVPGAHAANTTVAAAAATPRTTFLTRKYAPFEVGRLGAMGALWRTVMGPSWSVLSI